MQMDLLTGNQYIRVGIMGYINSIQGYDELGISHVKIEFQENNFHLIRTSPSGLVLTDNLALTNANGNYELYIGSVSGHNGRTHIDFDNFKLCREQEEPTCEDRVAELETQVSELQNKVTFLENLVEKLKSYMWFLPKSVKKGILCSSLEEPGSLITDFGLQCEMKELKNRNVCVCKKV